MAHVELWWFGRMAALASVRCYYFFVIGGGVRLKHPGTAGVLRACRAR